MRGVIIPQRLAFLLAGRKSVSRRLTKGAYRNVGAIPLTVVFKLRHWTPFMREKFDFVRSTEIP